MLNKKALLVVFLFITPLALGMDTRLVESMNITLVQEGYVRALGGELKSVVMNVSVPVESDYQKVVNDKAVSKIDEGNWVVRIESSSPNNPFNYKITSSVDIKARKTAYLPQSYQIGSLQMRYNQPSERIQSDDAKIKELARSITANSSDDFERISKLAIWVNSQLTYDVTLAGQMKNARWVLENRRGVCTEYSTLFIALVRSIGIPARFINGVAYDDMEGGWTGHSWAEVYIGTWVPVDPTWSPPEIGYLDAAHLEISKVVDNETYDSVFALTSQNARLDWSKSNVDMGEGITILGVNEVEPNSDYQLESAAGTIGFGMKTIVFASISSNDYRVAMLNLTPCSGSLVDVEGGGKEVILRPNERRIVTWVVNSNSKLSSTYLYKCPLVINSDYFDAKGVTIELASDAQPINFNAFMEKSELQMGENQTVYVDVGVARKYEGRLYLTHDEYYSFQPITRSGRYSFSLRPTRVGLNTLYLATSLGGVKELQFRVSGPQGIAAELDSPQLIPLGVEIKIYINLTSNETERSVRIVASAGGSKQTRQIALTGNRSIEFSFNVTDPNVRNITVVVESSDFLREFVKPVTIYKVPMLNLTTSPPQTEGDSIRVNLLFSGIEDARDVSVAIDGNPLSLASGGSASVLLGPGIHMLNINYSDAAGARYSYNKTLELPLISDIKKNETDWGKTLRQLAEVLPAVLYFGLLITLALAVVILKKIEQPQ